MNLDWYFTQYLAFNVHILRVNASGHCLLLVDPFCNLLIFTIQEEQFPALQELGEDIETARNAHQGHERKDDSNRLGVLHNKDTTEEEDLE